MKALTITTLAAAALLVACEPTTDSQYPDDGEPAGAPSGSGQTTEGVAGPAAPELNQEVSASDPVRLAAIGAVNANLSEQVGQSVVMNPEIVRSEGEWMFFSGPVRNIDGSAVDWSATDLAAAAAGGMMDGDVATVLLNWDGLDWRVVEAAIAPTDVPQVGWPDEHHVSPALVGLEG